MGLIDNYPKDSNIGRGDSCIGSDKDTGSTRKFDFGEIKDYVFANVAEGQNITITLDGENLVISATGDLSNLETNVITESNYPGINIPALSSQAQVNKAIDDFVIATNISISEANVRISTNESDIEYLQNNQMTGVEVYATLADLPGTGVLLTSYKVSNDPTPANNGYYHWDGVAYQKDYDLINGKIDAAEVESVSGSKINDLVHTIGISSFGTFKFTKSGSTINMIFDAAGSLYARGYDATEIATTTVQQGQTYSLPLANNVLVWNIDSDTIDVQSLSTARDEKHIVLLHANYGIVTGGYFAPEFWDWENSNLAINDINISSSAKFKFTKSGSTINMTFDAVGEFYAINKEGFKFATTTVQQGQTYSLPSANSVLVWNIDSDTIDVQSFDAVRDKNNIVLLRKNYLKITGGYFAPEFWDWENSNKANFDISFSGATSLDVEFSKSGNSIFITFPSIGTMYALGKDGQNISETTVHLGQTYELPLANNVLVWNIDSDTIDVQGYNAERDTNNIILLRRAWFEVTGGYFASKFWDWENYISTSNVEFMSREGRVNGFPGNSYLSAYECKRVQINNIRVSVRKTLDGYIVLSHDDAINDEARNMDGSPIVGTVNISENNLSILNTYDYGIKYGAQYAGLQIAELEPMINTCAKIGMKLTLEFKYAPTTLEIESICKLISKYAMVQETWISATSGLNILTEFRTQLNKLNIALIAYITSSSITEAATHKTSENNARLDFFDINTVTEALWYEAAQAGIDLKVGSVYTASDIPLWYNKGVKVIEVANIPFPDRWLNEYAS